MWDPDYDPYEQIALAHENIEQLARAYNAQHEHLNVIQRQYNHQQEIIKQLVFQNQKLNELIAMNRTEVATLKADIELAKIK